MSRTLVVLFLTVGALLVTQAGLPVYDDALFFRRFAVNLLDQGVWAWNPSDGPVYGNTSQLWQGMVLGLAAIARNWTLLGGRLFLGGCLVLSGVLLARTYPRAQGVVLVGMLSPIALATVLSGMETATTLALGAVLLSAPRSGALVTVLLYLARPDTLLLSVPTLLIRRQWRSLAVAGVALACVLGGMSWAYGSALPLSFSLKTGLSGLYDAHFLELSAAAGRKHLLFWVGLSAPVLVLGRRSRWMVPVVLFASFHGLVSIDVMGMHGRFYAPCLPWVVAAAAERWSVDGQPARTRTGGVLWLAWAGCLGLAVAKDWLPGSSGWSIGQVSGWSYLCYVAAVGAVLWTGRGTLLIALGVVLAHPVLPSQPLDDAASVARLRDLVSSWRGLEQAEHCLGSDLHVYHSEIGVPGFYFSRVTDLGGLMNAEVHAGLRFDEMCKRDLPELLFLPHRNYRELNREVRRSECLKGYQRVVKRSSSPLYIRKDLVSRYRSKDGC
jgi:hypothetical protein